MTRFPEVKLYRVIENLSYLLGLVLQVPLFLALYRALRKTSLAPALFGSALGILGLGALVVSTTPHVAHARLADLYTAPGTTPADQAIIALMWQGVWGMIDLMVYIGFFVIPLGIFALGAAMLSAPAFGKSYGWLTIVLATIGFAAALYQMIDTASMAAFGSYLAYIVFYLVLGWKLYSLSQGAVGSRGTSDGSASCNDASVAITTGHGNTKYSHLRAHVTHWFITPSSPGPFSPHCWGEKGRKILVVV